MHDNDNFGYGDYTIKHGGQNMTDRSIFEVAKNSREVIWLRLGEFKGKRFVDLRVYVTEEGRAPAPTKKGLTVPPDLWPQFRAALARVEDAMIRAGWLAREDLDHELR